MVNRIRKNTDIPMVFMTYANVVYSYGIEKLCSKMIEGNMSGMILPDVPFKKKKNLIVYVKSMD